MRRTMTALAGLAVFAYLGMCVLLFVFQRSLIYLPGSYAPAGDAPVMALPVPGGNILVTVQRKDGPRAVLYFGGNAEFVPYSLPGLAGAFPDRSLYLAHYRGYAGSSGSPSERAFFADALALFDAVHGEHPRITVVGRSIGSGVAAYLAAMRPVERLVLVTPFDSLAAVAARHYPVFPVRLLLRDRFDSFRYAPQVTAPTLLIAAEDDEVVPRSSTEALLASFRPGLASMVVLPGTSHNTIDLNPRYRVLLGSDTRFDGRPE